MQRFLFARIEVWLVLAVLILGLLGTVLFAAVVLDEERGNGRFGAIGAAGLAIAEVPQTVKTVLQNEDRMLVTRQGQNGPDAGWSIAGGAAATGVSGYWLLSRFDAGARRSIVEMVRLSDGSVAHVWRPDPDTLLADARRTSKVANIENWNTATFRYFEPYLMANGDLVLKDSASPLLRVNACAASVWMQDATTFHHSTESDGAGGFWIPSIIEPSQLPHAPEGFSDDALAHVSASDGRVLAQISVAGILMRHGLQHVVFPPLVENNDPVHLNDIEPVLQDGPYRKAGDLFLSLRHPSMVMLYRPATDEIVWMKQGPWMAQHDVDILDDHRIAVFDNRAYYRGTFGRVDGTSDIAVYDFANDGISAPYHDALQRENAQVLYEGLFSALPGGAFVVEDQTSGKVLLFGTDGNKLAQFVNRHEDGKIYQIGWGRYIAQDDGDQVLEQMKGINCNE